MSTTAERPALPGVIPYAVTQTSSGSYDVIVVGGGHHGLTAAAFLAKAGKRVLVIEAREVVGGMCWTKEMDGAPGYQVNPCALEVLLLGAQPSIVDQLDLYKYGLEYVYPNVLTTGLFPDGKHVTFFKDRAKTVENLKYFSPRDAVRYGELVDGITWALKAAMPYFMGPAFRPRPGAIWEIIKILLKGRRQVARGARVLLASMQSALDEYFESDQVKIALGNYSLANFGLMSDAGGGAYLTILTGAHEFGVRRPKGGSGQLTRALAACVVDHGGEIRVNTRVAEIKVSNGRTTGVALQSGEEISAKQVIAATDPVVLATKLLAASSLPASTHEQIRGLMPTINPINVFKADIALSRPLNFSGMGHQHLERHHFEGLSLCQSMADFHRSEQLCTRGDYDPSNMPQTNYVPSIVDPTLVPAGGEYLYLYASNSPQELSGGRTWETHAQTYLMECLKVFEQYAPGTIASVVDAYITTPPEFARRYNGNNGNYAQVGMGSPTQMGPWRPIPDFAGNKTPIDGLWHASSGSFPIPYLNGWAGRTVAGEVLRALR